MKSQTTLITIFILLCLFFYSTFKEQEEQKVAILSLESNIEALTSELATLRTSLALSNLQIAKNTSKLHNYKAKATITAYTPTVEECDSDPFITACMKPVKEGTVAVSEDLFKAGWTFGREVYLKGYGVFKINDLMNPRWNSSFDIFVYSKSAAKEIGRAETTAYLIF